MIPQVGSQLWADVRWRAGWRVQSHWALPLSRLVGANDRVRKVGSLAACERGLDDAVPSRVAPEHLVVVLHGLGRTRHSMRAMGRALTASSMAVARLDYPSTRDTIEAHASHVVDLLDNMQTPVQLSFVTHSLGGLVVRKILSNDRPWRSSVHRVAMLAPPNQGAALARTLDTKALRAVMGPSFVQIVRGVPQTLPAPSAPTSIIAGRIGRTHTDGLVTIEETKLEGMAEHHVVPSMHTFVMNHPAAIARAVEFLGAPHGG
ncbi:MAG: hypothetical protein WBG86_10160 [Polyangiales bacterium]